MTIFDFNKSHTLSFYPLLFIPQFQYRLWGGDKLATVLNKQYSGNNRGESWEISAVEDAPSIIANGRFKGLELTRLVKDYPQEILGEKPLQRFGETFPLLIKFIDAQIPLSVQVHPDDDYAKKQHDSFGKNEMWYIVQADEDAVLTLGFKKEIDKKTFLTLIEEQRLEEVLHRENVKAGDAVYIPSGKVHAIGGGILLAEIQQTSDITYRIYDYNRIDSKTGQPRGLHNDHALEVVDFSLEQQKKINYSKQINTGNAVISTPYFSTDIYFVTGNLSRTYTGRDSFHILLCVEGHLMLSFETIDYELNFGQCLLIPAAVHNIEINGQGTFLEVFIA